MLVRIAALAAALVLGSVATSSAADMVFVDLASQNNSGEVGTAILRSVPEGVLVIVGTSGQGSDPQPNHIHKGSCAHLDPKPAYPFKALTNGTSETLLTGVTLAQLTSGGYAINIHKSVKEIGINVACGDIPKQ
jgi:hypothetical protein